MSTIVKFHSSAALREIAYFIVGCALLTGAAYGQAAQPQPDKFAYAADPGNVPEAIAKVKSGDFDGIHVEMIARAGAVEAIPSLRDQFVRTQDPLTKAKIAYALVKLGEKDNSYWDFLVNLATPAVTSDAPSLWDFDQHGKVLQGPSPEFLAWAKANKLDPITAGEDAMYTIPAAVLILAETGDRRGIPLLRRALLSANFLIEDAAARGLAEIKDQDSIPLIIKACERAPAESAAAIARSLVYFDDPQAQNAVDKYVPKDTAKIYREARANGKTPFR